MKPPLEQMLLVHMAAATIHTLPAGLQAPRLHDRASPVVPATHGADVWPAMPGQGCSFGQLFFHLWHGVLADLQMLFIHTHTQDTGPLSGICPPLRVCLFAPLILLFGSCCFPSLTEPEAAILLLVQEDAGPAPAPRAPP